MKSFYNTKPEFGMGGPFDAPSRESLADEMLPTFTLWAEEKWNKDEDPSVPNKESYIYEAIHDMRREFIAGLEER